MFIGSKQHRVLDRFMAEVGIASDLARQCFKQERSMQQAVCSVQTEQLNRQRVTGKQKVTLKGAVLNGEL